MTADTQLTHTEIAAADFLSAAGTIPTNNANTCSLNDRWISPATFLEWAQRGFADADDYGLANTITYAKRAVCCRIDRLIRNYHLWRLHRTPFPAKIAALEDVGLGIPSVIQELIINPRNELEHDYIPADPDTARRSLDIARLFLTATDTTDAQEAIIVLSMNMLCSHGTKDGEQRVTFDGWSGGPMLFMDIFGEPQAAKIVDSEKGEVLYTKLADFTQRQAVQLAGILHSHYLNDNHGSSGTGRFFYTEIKRLAGF